VGYEAVRGEIQIFLYYYIVSSQEGDNMATDNAVEDNSGTATTAAVANNSNNSNDNTIATNNNSNNEQPPSINNNNNTSEEEEEKRKKKEDEASQKRRAIQSIMKDTTLTDLERRFRIQNLMDGSSSSKKQNGGKVGRDGSIGMGREELLRGGICRSTAVTASLRNLGTSLLGSAASGGSGVVNSTTSATAGGNTNQEQQNTGVTPCIHYERKCNIISPCCQRIFGCRICHDDVMNLLGGGSGAISSPLPPGGIGIGDGECGPMDRFGIKEIVCKECNVLQDSK